MLAETGKAAVIHPTGTGKSFIAFKLCEDHPQDKVCWLAPSEYIFRTQQENLKKTGAAVPENIFFCTYAKLAAMSGAEIAALAPDLIILDEFHRAGAEVWGRAVNQLLDANPNVPLLGLSATNIRYLDNQRDMADELFGGYVASEISLSEAIVRGILQAPKYVLSVFKYQQQLDEFEARIARARSKPARDRAEEYLQALRRALELSDGLDEVFRRHMADRSGKYLVFCANREHMQQMLALVPEWFGKVDADAHVYSVCSDDPETSKEFQAFQADSSRHLKLLFCIDMLNEGIHVEDVSGVILLRPTVSPIIYKQQIGRALSAGNGRRPVIFDVVLNIRNLTSISALREEMDDLVAWYREHGMADAIVNDRFELIDEVRDCLELFDQLNSSLSATWDRMFEAAERYYQQHGDLLVPRSYCTEDGYSLGCWVRTQRENYLAAPRVISAKHIARLESIGMCWQVCAGQWEKTFEAVRSYYLKNGSLNDMKKNAKALSDWLTRQRQKYRQGLLTPEQADKLASVGIVWSQDEAWNASFAAAKEYARSYGNLDIPAKYVTPEGLKLGAWYRAVRTAYKNGRLPEERAQMLQAIGAEWMPLKERTWRSYYEKAKQYALSHGDADIAVSYQCEDGTKLGSWASAQRSAYAKGKLPAEYIQLLEEIGFCWQRFDSRWEAGCRAAEEYYALHSSLDVPGSYVTPEGFPLGRWLGTQRTRMSQHKLAPERAEKLTQLAMRWDVFDAAWEEGYLHAKSWHTANGTLAVPSGCVCDDGFKLGAWLTRQRTAYKSGKLPADKISALEEIGMCWSPADEKWQDACHHAREYRNLLGNKKWSSAYVSPDGHKTGEWIRAQLRQDAGNNLSAARRSELVELGFI